MAQIGPFKAVRYNLNAILDLSSVVAPPYDVIPKAMQESLYRAHPYNIVRLILGKIKKDDDPKNNRYIRAKKFFDLWLKRGILEQDRSEGLYIYSQKYAYENKDIERIGFIGLMGLDLGKGESRVLPHENTLLAPKLDRLRLMREVRANLSPIFVLYDDKKHKIINILKNFCSKEKAILDIDFENVRHRVWRLDKADIIKRIESFMGKKNIFIADGHHRYEVARMYSQEIQNKNLTQELKDNSRYIMVYFVESDEKILTILPAHRLVKNMGALKKAAILEKLSEFFLTEKMPSLKGMMTRLHSLSGSHVFGMYLGGRDFYILRLKDIKEVDKVIKGKSKDWRRLGVSILHLFILQHALGIRDEDDNIEFVKDEKDVVKLVNSGKFKMAFLLNPTKAWQVERIAKLGERMPRKATYFYPKPLSGLVINKH